MFIVSYKYSVQKITFYKADRWMAGLVGTLPQTSSWFSFVPFTLTPRPSQLPPTPPIALVSTLTEKKKKKRRTALLYHMVTDNTTLCLHIDNHMANRRTHARTQGGEDAQVETLSSSFLCGRPVSFMMSHRHRKQPSHWIMVSCRRRLDRRRRHSAARRSDGRVVLG